MHKTNGMTSELKRSAVVPRTNSNVKGLSRILMIKAKDLGQVGAGRAVEFLPAAQKMWIPRPANARAGDEYARGTISGDSLIDNGINDGDYMDFVTNFHKSEIKNGILVLVFIHSTQDVLVKYIFDNKNGTVTLKAANPAYEDTTYDWNDIEVQGIADQFTRKIRWR